MRCDELQELVAELALGVADGKSRADALAHLSGCPECRRAVQELAGVSDALLLLAPEHEPSPGFELEVLDRVGLRPQTLQRRIRRWIPAASGAILAAAAATAAALVFSYQSDRQIASYYRATLANARGQYFQTAALQAPGGRRAGELFLYQGSPSWIFVSMSRKYLMSYRCELITRQGATVEMSGTWQGSWGTTLSIPAKDVAAVRLLGINRPLVLRVGLPAPPAAT
jgi:hypothetical protein